MRVPHIVREFAAWRWAPCVALITGSLLYVALAVALVPAALGNAPVPVQRSASVDTLQGASALGSRSFGTSIAEAAPQFGAGTRDLLNAALPARVAVSSPPQQAPEMRRGFSPPIEQPERPMAAPPPPPPVAPTSTLAPESAAVPPVPSAPPIPDEGRPAPIP